MKKAIILAAIALSLSISFSMLSSYMPYHSEPVGSEITEDDSADSNIPDDAEEAGLAYINTEMDIFTYIEGSGWYYENYNGLIVFYNENALIPTSSIALSSLIYPVNEDVRDSQTEMYIQQAGLNLENIIENIKLTKMYDFEFSNGSAYRYCYTGSLIANGENVAGEYMYWWIDDREYTCSLYCLEEEYEFFSAAMHSLITNFQQPSKME